MLRGTAGRRYAEGVFAIAKDQRAYDRWLADLAAIENVFSDSNMARFITDPKPAAQRKATVVEQLLRGRVDELALHLALILVRRGHAAAVPALRRELQRLINEERNVAVAQVTTAVPLDGVETNLMRERLSALTAKQVELETAVDPSVLGGFVARVGDVLIDASLASRLEAMRQQLLTSQ